MDEVKFTRADIMACWPHYEEYFLEILNLEYDIEEARKDLSSLINSKYDLRTSREYVIAEEDK
jgi:hypothetical protein